LFIDIFFTHPYGFDFAEGGLYSRAAPIAAFIIGTLIKLSNFFIVL